MEIEKHRPVDDSNYLDLKLFLLNLIAKVVYMS